MDYWLAFQIAGLIFALGAIVQILKPWDLD